MPRSAGAGDNMLSGSARSQSGNTDSCATVADKCIAPISDPASSPEYPQQKPLTPETLGRLSRLFLLLASVTLPEESANEESLKDPNDSSG